ncbi:hypothetical protein [Alicycliphilus denitrificans]|uniref:hypothetical protein n=1 Tax=Alicycliphilus denitrificans TaxID=179636 RepID=UPI0011D2180C|nr:hypothetical protein [Alicycliphilus denitrificans]
MKDTPEWKATRADYLRRLRERAAADPDFAARQAAARRAAVRRYYDRLTPEQLETYRASRRDWYRNLTPEKKAARKYWYGSLSLELKRLFLLELRQARALQRLQEVNALSGRRVRWDHANDHLLGTMPDGELAAMLAVSIQTIKYHRLSQGIELRRRGGEWTEDEIKLLGTDADRVIAEKLGRSAASVTLRRLRLGIAAARRTGRLSIQPGAPQAIRISDEMRELFAELEPLLLPRYQGAGLPVDRLEPWQITEIALRELLATLRKSKARGRI